MKKSIFILSILISSLFASSQTFEGQIIYELKIKSKLPNVSDAQFTSMMGTKQEYYIKGGDYRTVSNGSMLKWQLYKNSDNKLYSKMSNSEAVLWNDGQVNTDTVYSFEINKSVISILGYDCDEVILKCKSGIQKYYYNSKIGINSSEFENHLYGNWYEFVKLSNALPLKMIVDGAQFTMVSEAVEVNAKKMNVADFELPVGVKTTKSPY
ncbi:MAG: hypothetical protein ACPGD5_04515 [Salibacteraceae bacterium]